MSTLQEAIKWAIDVLQLAKDADSFGHKDQYVELKTKWMRKHLPILLDLASFCFGRDAAPGWGTGVAITRRIASVFRSRFLK